jgi:hypothetical protein
VSYPTTSRHVLKTGGFCFPSPVASAALIECLDTPSLYGAGGDPALRTGSTSERICANLSHMTAESRARDLSGAAMHLVVVVLVAWILASALPAHPLPLGKTDQHLYADSDLVAEVLVVAVTFLGEAENRVGGHDKSYEALLRVLKVIKGPSDQPTTIKSSWIEHIPPMLGSQTVPFSQGERALVYMVREENGTYRPVWWNAKKPIPSAGRGKPSSPGETK